jgi:hypothetical protein
MRMLVAGGTGALGAGVVRLLAGGWVGTRSPSSHLALPAPIAACQVHANAAFTRWKPTIHNAREGWIRVAREWKRVT